MLKYIQYDRHPKNYHNLGISAVNKSKNNLDMEEERDLIELDFGPTTDILKGDYLDVYEGTQSEIVNTKRFNKISDLRTTYLGKSDRSKNDQIKAEAILSHIRARVHIRKMARQNRMSNIVRHRSY